MTAAALLEHFPEETRPWLYRRHLKNAWPKYFQLLAGRIGVSYVRATAESRIEFRTPAARLDGDELESRKSTRFQLEVPVLCRWQQNDRRAEFDGVTRDVSTGGIFIRCTECPPVGATVSFEATVPSLQSAASPLRMEGFGRVLRVHQEEDVERCGFAASAGFTLRDTEDELADFKDGR